MWGGDQAGISTVVTRLRKNTLIFGLPRLMQVLEALDAAGIARAQPAFVERPAVAGAATAATVVPGMRQLPMLPGGLSLAGLSTLLGLVAIAAALGMLVAQALALRLWKPQAYSAEEVAATSYHRLPSCERGYSSPPVLRIVVAAEEAAAAASTKA